MRALTRTGLALALVGSLAALAGGGGSASAYTARDQVRLNNFEGRTLDLINRARAQHGLAPLKLLAATTDVARRWTVRMTSAGDISHNPSLRADLTALGCGHMSLTGENVAYNGTGADDMFTMFMNSPGHRANILDPRFKYVGLGTTERVRQGWLTAFQTQVFVSSCTSYAGAREPAHGMRAEATRPTQRVDFLHAENGRDLRVMGTVAGSGLKVNSLVADTASAADDAIRMKVSAIAALVSGSADFVVRDAVDLTNVKTILVALAQSNPRGGSLPVKLALKEGWGTSAVLGQVTVKPGAPQVFALTVPASMRRFVNHVVLSVPGPGLVSLATGLLTQQTATLAVHRITFVV